jgi:lysophospholipase L1-like esterase
MNNPPTTAPTTNNDNYKIFCFGDSLTAGTSPPSFQDYPYAPHLESKLNELDQNQNQNQQKKYLVRHFGLPGWTSTQLSSHEGNLNSILERIKDASSDGNTYPSLVIILAGTNDLSYCTNENQCHDIFQSIQNIHYICHEKNIDTVGLSIPPSAWQCQSNSNNAASYATLINEKIQTWATETQEAAAKVAVEGGGENRPVVHFVPFPIHGYDHSSGYWSSDGLHFSPEGYTFIGKELAPQVKNILDLKSG